MSSTSEDPHEQFGIHAHYYTRDTSLNYIPGRGMREKYRGQRMNIPNYSTQQHKQLKIFAPGISAIMHQEIKKNKKLQDIVYDNAKES